MSRCLILGGPVTGGGGGISQLTSTGSTVTITNPFGPVSDLEVAAGGGITQITNSDGSVSVTNPLGPTTTLSAPGTEIQGRPVSAALPGTGQAVEWNGSLWVPQTTVNSIANGTGITGATGSNPVPAVLLPTLYVDLGATNFTLTNAAENHVFTLPGSLSAGGTYLLTWALCLHMGGTIGATFACFVLPNTGTPATLTFPGTSGNPSSSMNLCPIATGANNFLNNSGSMTVQCTGTGLVDLVVYVTGASGTLQAVAQQGTGTHTLQTSWFQSVRIG